MKKYQKQKFQTRRNFLRQSVCASLGMVGVVNSLAQMRLFAASVGAAPVLTDYKALVCVFLAGGNDSFNMLVPMGDPATDEARADYETSRGIALHSIPYRFLLQPLIRQLWPLTSTTGRLFLR
jgi:uncharacterized protein (DUF1501 family)